MVRTIAVAAKWLLVLFVVLSIVPYLVPTRLVTTRLPAQPFPESSFADVAGTSLHYRVWRPAHAPSAQVLLVHGMGGSTFSWRDTVEPLTRAGFLVIAVDLPGFGYSERGADKPHDLSGQSELLWQMLDSFEAGRGQALRGPWHLVGHSMGGAVVTQMAVTAPQRTRSVTLVAGSMFPAQGRFDFALRYPPTARWLEVIFTYYFVTTERLGNLLAGAYGRPPTQAEVEGYLAPLRVIGTGATLSARILSRDTVPIEALAQATFPVHAIWGERDTWVPVEQAHRLVELVPRTHLTLITEAAHCPMETHTALFNSALIRFLMRAR